MIWATKKVKKLSASCLGRQKNQLNETFAASHVHLMDHSGESSVQIIDSYPNGEKNPNGVISWYFLMVPFYWITIMGIYSYIFDFETFKNDTFKNVIFRYWRWTSTVQLLTPHSKVPLMGSYQNFFVFNLILMKFGEVVVPMDTTTSPSFIKIGLKTKKFSYEPISGTFE